MSSTPCSSPVDKLVIASPSLVSKYERFTWPSSGSGKTSHPSLSRFQIHVILGWKVAIGIKMLIESNSKSAQTQLYPTNRDPLTGTPSARRILSVGTYLRNIGTALPSLGLALISSSCNPTQD